MTTQPKPTTPAEITATLDRWESELLEKLGQGSDIQFYRQEHRSGAMYLFAVAIDGEKDTDPEPAKTMQAGQ